MTGPVILGRIQAKAMGYIQFPQIWWPHALTTFPDTSRKLCTHRTPTPKTALHSQALSQAHTPSLLTQNQTNRDNTDQASTTDYRTSTTTHKMEHRLHTTQW